MIIRTRRGFTLIELLVVIAIIGLLASIILVSLAEARNKAKTIAAIRGMKEIENALELYYAKYGYYPNQEDYNNNGLDDDNEAIKPGAACDVSTWFAGWDIGGIDPNELHMSGCIDLNGDTIPFLDPLVQQGFISTTAFASNHPIYYIYGYGDYSLGNPGSGANNCYITSPTDKGIDYALIAMNLTPIPGLTDTDECDTNPQWDSNICSREAGDSSYCILRHR